jgi:hypothetical protein
MSVLEDLTMPVLEDLLVRSLGYQIASGEGAGTRWQRQALTVRH